MAPVSAGTAGARDGSARPGRGADHRQHPVFGHQRQRPGQPEQDARLDAALFERVEIGQHHQRQRHELQQVRIVFKALEIEDRIV